MQGFEQIEHILESFLGAPKSDTDGAQRQYNCPCCAAENGGVPDGKYNLEVNIAKGVFQCWKCGDTDGTKGNLGTLIRKYGGTTLYRRYKEEMNVIIKSKLYNIDFFDKNKEISKPKKSLHLPSTFKKINLDGYCKQSVREYIEKRGIDQQIIDKFNLGYTEWEEDKKDWSYRIIIPSYNEAGELNFFTGRDYLPEKHNSAFVRPKYKNIDAEKKEIVFQESLVDWDAPIYLCEGAIDCIFPPNGIALLGKTLYEDSYLYASLLKKANSDIIICLDSDTQISETVKIYKMLNRGRLKDKIWYIRLEKYKDFGEIFEAEGRKGMIAAFKTAKQFSETELIF